MAEQRVTDEQLTDWEHYKLATGHVGLGLRQQRDLVADLRASRAREAELLVERDQALARLRERAHEERAAAAIDARERNVLQQRVEQQRADLEHSFERLHNAEQRLNKLHVLTYASDDGTEYSHSHRRGEGEPECPACWAHDIRAALTGTETS